MADLSIKELDQVLQGWRGRTIRVEKEEQGNRDQVTLELDRVRYVKNESIDDYVGHYVLELHGAGTVEPEPGAPQASLPGATFEIPLTTQDQYRLQQGRLELRTPRGAYRLWPEPTS
ncbi:MULTISPECIES: hypothetical protein [Limnochorda]|uniref:hypothetical protein n=1 Tax=Limnochorda TaxID=1676651 RepID=UPI0017F981ED|nr:hypothetical protein [Limnochorda pilosa]MBO2486197.1 hypothetical protein [Bacillota bacterium]MBO2519667.1 hypothetical protein [Bacillota bacterium]NMA70295.1 hypothetical protein [Bacillota bacterium]